MLNIWTKASGYSFGVLAEELAVNIPLPVANDTGVNYSVISGKLPGGLYIKEKHIIGSPFIVAYSTKFEFCIRASANASSTNSTIVGGAFVPTTVTSGTFLVGMKLSGAGIPAGTYITSDHHNGTFGVNTTENINSVNVTATGFADRTFFISIDSNHFPTFITSAGNLPIGPNQQFYTTDQTYVEYQLEVIDISIATNRALNFFIASGDGSLPPGLTLSNSGLISGYILPLPKITTNVGLMSVNDVGGSTNSFDSYQYDTIMFDYNIPASVKHSLSLNYQFKVTVTDGVNNAYRIFKIFVAGTDEFRADATILDGQADGFTADSTYVRSPQWLTNSSLGTFRSNNYLTVPVALYDNTGVTFRKEPTNHETYAVAYQIYGLDNIITSNTVTIDNVSVAPKIGQWFTLNYYVEGALDNLYQIIQVDKLTSTRYRLTLTSKLLVSIPNNTAFYIGTLCRFPTGINFDPLTGDLYGMVPYQPSVTEKFTFTITATRTGDSSQELVSTSKEFNLIMLGSIHSQITWISPSNLGTISADYICTLRLLAETSVAAATVTYTVVKGSLPPGINLKLDGELVGIPNQFYNAKTHTLGLITIDSGSTTFDRNTTTIDRTYTFSVESADQYGYSAITKEFTLTIDSPNDIVYNNIIVRPYLIPEQRNMFKSFINNSTVFTPSSIYRPTDTNFGIQTSLTMLVYAGIEAQSAASIVGAMGLNTKRKRFQFKSIQKAIAVDPVSNEPVYEVVYIKMIDPLEPNGKHLPLSINSVNSSEKITADTSNSLWQKGFEVHKLLDGSGNIMLDPITGEQVRNPTTIEQAELDGLAINAPFFNRPDYNITVDSTGYQINTPNPNTYFPSSITNWQKRISTSINSYTVDGSPILAKTERNYLPLWMRSIPSGQKQQLGYILAIPLCFCKVGTADTILLNIKHSDFDFTKIDYTIDRYTITSAAGYTDDKYLIFKNNRITV